MGLSKRERWVAIAAVAALLIFVGDRFLLRPFEARREAVRSQTEELLEEFARAEAVFQRRARLEPEWRGMLENGLAGEIGQQEGRVLDALRRWSEESGLALSSLRPERVTSHGGIEEITFQASGTGRMESVVGFLWRLESSEMPVRVAEMQIGSRREGQDDLSLQLRVSALCRPADAGGEDEDA